MTEDRIAKVLARAGVCSRRDAEKMIAEGRVAVDGRVLDSPAVKVGESARIEVDGKLLPARAATRLWRYHKPKGLVTTHKDPQDRPTVFDALPKDLPRVISVGRLDFNTEGLLLLTNDGDLARKLELPANGWKRTYRVRVHGRVQPSQLDSLAAGVTVEGVRYSPIQARLERQQGANGWLEVTISEGKNREVRRVMEHIGLNVNRLIRVAYGPFGLGTLSEGAVEEIPAAAVSSSIGADGKPVKRDRSGWAKAKPKPNAPRKPRKKAAP